MKELIDEQEVEFKKKMSLFQEAAKRQSDALAEYLRAKKAKQEIELDLRETLSRFGYELEGRFNF